MVISNSAFYINVLFKFMLNPVPVSVRNFPKITHEMISIEEPHTYRDLKAAIAKFPVIQVDEKEEEDVDATAS